MYPILVTLSLIIVFGSSAFMSISGLVSIFSNHTPIIISLGLGMEVGKILTISHLYRSWQNNSRQARTGYIIIIFVLTLLTSFEVMGFLSECHQKATGNHQLIKMKIDALNKEEAVLTSQVDVIDSTLSGLPDGYVSRRINERNNFGYSEKQNRLLEIIREKSVLETRLLSEDENFNPVSSIGKISGINEATIIALFIPFLVLILEPLSIGLTVATNSAWMNYQRPGPESSPPKEKAEEIDSPESSALSNTEKLKELQEKH